MKHLADSVLDYLLYLNFGAENEYDRDHTSKLLEELTDRIENYYTDNEKQALCDAATRRLDIYTSEVEPPDLTGTTPLTEEQQQFLKSVAAGQLSGIDSGG